jgi:hypothetical protein
MLYERSELALEFPPVGLADVNLVGCIAHAERNCLLGFDVAVAVKIAQQQDTDLLSHP